MSGKTRPNSENEQSVEELPLPTVPDPDEVDRRRQAFRAAFDEYTRQGNRMKDLLLSFDPGKGAERKENIGKQQVCLTEAQKRYEQARADYVSYVLGPAIAKGGGIL